MEELMLKIDNVSKQYKLGQIGGTTLYHELQRLHAKRKGLADPTKQIGAKDYNKGELFMALDGISFEVKKGERVGIIGHNGAGKSTLLKLISRITAPTSGTIGMNGRVASMLEVGTGFHPELTGRENVYMNGAILGMTKKEIDAKLEDIIDFSECREFIDTPVRRYSSGMYVKLAFSVAAHLDSEILIMDEVLAVGDMAFQKKCLDKMNDVSRQEGRTILYVSHNMNTIRQLCDRVIVLDHGKVVFDGGVEDGIGVYMEANKEGMGVTIDISKKRMSHLPNEIKAKMINVSLPDKSIASFECRENIIFDLCVAFYQDIKHCCVRMELRGADDYPVGASVCHDLGDFFAGDNKTIRFSLKKPPIVPGFYKALIVLYGLSEFGNYEDLDAVWPTFTFEVTDSFRRMGIVWNPIHWGKVQLPDLERQVIQ